MDELQDYESNLLMSMLQYSHRDLWEMCRLQTLYIIKGYCSKNVQFQDIVKFAWEYEDERKKQELDNNTRDELMSFAKQFEKNFKKIQTNENN